MSTPRASRAELLEALRPELDALQAEADGQLGRVRRRLLMVSPFMVLLAVGGLLLGTVPEEGLWRVAFLIAGVGGSFVVFVIAILSALHGLLGFVAASRLRVAKRLAPLIGFKHAEIAPDLADFSAFDGTAYGGLLSRAQASNVLSGVVGGAQVQIFDARASSPDTASRAGDAARMVATARVARVAIPGRWTARTVIIRDSGLANAVAFRAPDMKRVGLVDARFEDVFEVHSSDQVEARALLTPAFMERLMALEDLFAASERAPVAAFADGAFMVALAAFGPRIAASPAPGGAEQEVRINAERLVDEALGVLGMVEALVLGATEEGAS